MEVRIKYGKEPDHPAYTKGVIFYDGKAVGYLILTDKELPERNLSRILPSGSVYLSYIEIFPNFRGNGIGAQTVGKLTKDLKRKGYDYLVLEPRAEVAGWWESMGFFPIAKDDWFLMKRL